MNSYTVEVLVFVDSTTPAEAERVVTEVIADGIGRLETKDSVRSARWLVSDVRTEDGS